MFHHMELGLQVVIEDYVRAEKAAESVVKESLTTAADGKAYRTKVYNLDAILAVGYRVRSPRGTQFRRWATTAAPFFVIRGVAWPPVQRSPGGTTHAAA